MYDTVSRHKNYHIHLYNKELNHSFRSIQELTQIIESSQKINPHHHNYHHHKQKTHHQHHPNVYEAVASQPYVTQHIYLNNANITYFYEPRQTAVVPQCSQMIYPYFYEEVRLETPSYNYVGCYASEGSSMNCNEFFF